MPVNRLRRAAIIQQTLDNTKNKEIKRVAIKGDTKELYVIRLETEHFLYNPQLGRLALNEGIAPRNAKGESQRDPEDPRLQRDIEQALLEDRPDIDNLKKHIEQEGQLEPGIATYDGVLINGNRRLAVLRALWNEPPKREKFKYMNVAILPKETTPAEMYLLEVTLQMTPETRARYGPITTLVELRRGIDKYKLEKEEVAKAMYLEPSKVDEYVELLQLIDEYLQFVKQPGKHKILEGGARVGKYEHFLTLYRLKEKHGQQPFWQALQYHIFQMIRAGKTYEEIRDLKKWEVQDVLEFGKRVGKGTKTATVAPKVDPKIAELAGDLQGITENVNTDAATAATLIPVPRGPTSPDKSPNEVKPADDPELAQTLAAIETVNDIVGNRQAKKRPVELLSQALRKLEAVDLPAALAADSEATPLDLKEVKLLLDSIVKVAEALRERCIPTERSAKKKGAGKRGPK